MTRSDTALDTIVLGDCIKVMSRMASAAVDFVLTDPPTLRTTARAQAKA